MTILIENHDYLVTPHPDTEKWRYVWEPLKVYHTPDRARAHCCYINTVIFYDQQKWEKDEIEEVDRATHDITMSPTLILIEGIWYYVISGSCVFKDMQWWMRWMVGANYTEAQRQNAKNITLFDVVSHHNEVYTVVGWNMDEDESGHTLQLAKDEAIDSCVWADPNHVTLLKKVTPIRTGTHPES